MCPITRGKAPIRPQFANHSRKFDQEVDVLVVGSWAGALAAEVVAGGQGRK